MWNRPRSRRGSIAAILGAALIVFGVALYPVDQERCDAWAGRPLTYSGITPGELRQLRDDTPVYETPPPVSALTPDSWKGMALPGAVLLNGQRAAGGYAYYREYVHWHELLHVAQMRDDGIARFLVRYGGDLLGGRVRGCGLGASYEAVRYEREARELGWAMLVADPAHPDRYPRLLDWTAWIRHRTLDSDSLLREPPAPSGVAAAPLRDVARLIREYDRP